VPLPKRRHSISRRNKRRSHDRLTLPNLSVCPKCNEPRLSHRVCPACGYYKGRLVLPEAAE
jgi:large subunit ribosomal protein L32